MPSTSSGSGSAGRGWMSMPDQATTRVPDMAAIDALIDWAETEHAKGTASGWDQNDFATPRPESDCGTAYCIAGKWGIDHGWTFQFRHRNLPVWRAPDGSMSGTPSVDAADALGIPRLGYTADRHLFEASNTIEDLRRIADGLRAGVGADA